MSSDAREADVALDLEVKVGVSRLVGVEMGEVAGEAFEAEGGVAPLVGESVAEGEVEDEELVEE